MGIVDWELLFSFYGEYNFKLIDKYFLSGWDGWVGKFLVLFFFDIILSDIYFFDLILVYGLRINVIVVMMKIKKLLKNYFLLFLKFFIKWK